jgi:hypothetical protein
MSLFSAGLFGPDIPDSVIAGYDYENTGDTSVATDIIGSNNINLTAGASYNTSDPICGSASISVADTTIESQNSVDLANNGTADEFTIVTEVRPDTTSGGNVIGGWHQDSNNLALFEYGYQTDSNYGVYFQINGTNYTFSSSTAPDTNTSVQLALVVNQPDLTLYIDGTQAATSSFSESLSSNFGAGVYSLGSRSDASGNEFDGNLDQTYYANAALSSSDIETLQC